MKFALPSLPQVLMIVATAVLAVNSVAAAHFLPGSARVDKGLTLYLPSPVQAIAGSIQAGSDSADSLDLDQIRTQVSTLGLAGSQSVLSDSRSRVVIADANGYHSARTTQSDVGLGQADLWTLRLGNIDSSQSEYGGILNTNDIAMLRQVIPSSGQDGESSPASVLAIIVLLLGGLGYAQLQGKSVKPQHAKRQPLFPG